MIKYFSKIKSFSKVIVTNHLNLQYINLVLKQMHDYYSIYFSNKHLKPKFIDLKACEGCLNKLKQARMQ